MPRRHCDISNHGSRRSRNFRGGFTLIELLVTLSIVALVVGASVPLLSVMSRDTAVTSGLNTVTVAVEAARQLATGQAAKKDPLADGGSTEGTAMMVTNSGSIRLLEHQGGNAAGLTGEQKGFRDVDGRDYITLSPRTGMVGIKRQGTGAAGLRFVAPPFAIRFNDHGSLVYGNPADSNGAFVVYYDKNYAGGYDADSRPNNYNPAAAASAPWNNTAGNYELPFGEIDTVVGVYVFDTILVPDLTADAGQTYISSGSTNGQLILEHGRAVFFNRVTGAPVYRK